MNPRQCHECGSRITTTGELEALEPEPIDLDIAPGTRHHRLLNTNETPLDSDSIFVKPAISNAGLRLVKIDDEIARLRDRLERLEEERASLSIFHSKNIAILSPLRRMPAEILCEIFSLTLPSLSEATDCGRFDVKNSPWVLGHICSHWRAIALSSPSLWSLVVINLKNYHPDDYDPLLPASAYPLVFLETQIQRARTLDLFFSTHPSQSSHAMDLFKLLVANCMRWKRLDATLVPEMLTLMAPLRGHVPLLHRLAIEWHSNSLPESAVDIDCFHEAPSLCALATGPQLSVSFPAHQLTQYELAGTSTTHLLVLKQAVNLVKACILIDPPELPGFSGEVIDLIHLRQLHVTHTVILDSFRLPELDSLSYESEADDGPQILVHVRSLFDRSVHAPRRLCAVGFPDGETTGEILHAYPSIIEFATIIHLGLRCISLGIESGASSDYTAYMNSYMRLLQARWRTENRALKCAELFIPVGPSPDNKVLDALDSLRRDGLDVVLAEGSAAETLLADWICFLPDCL
ncbi:hypothetical protein FB451DRAFT_106651 [Mycena latifolia]|nr:hypothetical protein FB451DRAFT_106651 [Mycena latifolia]